MFLSTFAIIVGDLYLVLQVQFAQLLLVNVLNICISMVSLM